MNRVIQVVQLSVNVIQTACATANTDAIDNFVQVVSQLIEFSQISLDVAVRSVRIVSQLVDMVGFADHIGDIGHQVTIFTGTAGVSDKFSVQILSDILDVMSETDQCILTASFGVTG